MIRGDPRGRLCEEALRSVDYDPFQRFGHCESYGSAPSHQRACDWFNVGDSSTRHDLRNSSFNSLYAGFTVFSDSEDGHTYSSYDGLPVSSSPVHIRPAPIGSRGGGVCNYPQNKCGGQCSDRGVHTAVRGKGIWPRPPVHSDYQDLRPNQPAVCGKKRKIMVSTRSTMVVKKHKLIRPLFKIQNKTEQDITQDCFDSQACDTGLVTKVNLDKDKQKVMEFRREKQRRRRNNHNEKYGDMYRLAYTCAFCKYHTFEDKDIETHFGGASHRETLDYIRKQAKYDEGVIRFLHESMVSKFRKTVYRKLNSRSRHTTERIPKEVMEGVTEDDYMRKMEMVHCAACETHLPAVLSSVQQHLNSSSHLQNKVVYKEQLKRESVFTANSILNSANVKARYEKYVKGEDPFNNDAREELLNGDQEDSSSTEGDLNQVEDILMADEMQLEDV